MSEADRTTIAAQRKIPSEKLRRLLRGELDRVVMKALEKDRKRRYESVNAFASDIERFLNHEPVSAVAPSLRYRASKFIRRNRVALVTGILFGLVLISGAAISTWQAIRATRYAIESRRQSQLVRETFSQSDFAVAGQFIERGQPDLGIAYLCRALRSSPTNEAAKVKLLCTLAYYNFIPLLLPPLEHRAVIRHLDLSADGNRAVTGGDDQRVGVWDLNTGQRLGQFLEGDGPLTLVGISSNGTRVIIGGEGPSTRLWELASPSRSSRVLSGRLKALSSDRTKAIFQSAEDMTTATVWDIERAGPIGPPLRQKTLIVAAAVSPDGEIACTKSAEEVNIWAPKRGMLLRSLPTDRGEVDYR